jgi:hypothetical protein
MLQLIYNGGAEASFQVARIAMPHTKRRDHVKA